MADQKLKMIVQAEVASAVKNLEKVRTGTDAVSKSAARAQTQLADGMKKAAKWGAIASLAIGTKAVMAASAFEKSMANVNTLLGDDTAQFKKLEKGVLEFSKISIKPMAELSESMYDIVSAGIAADDQLSALAESERLAVAGLGSVKEATNLMTSSMNAFAAQGFSAAEISDILFTTVKRGKTTVAELSQGFGGVAAAAAVAGVKLDELMSATAALTTTGLPATEAYTQLSAAMKALQKPTAAMSDLLAKAGFASGTAAIESVGLVGALQALNEAGEGNNEMLIEAFGRMEGYKAAAALAGANAEAFADTLADTRDGLSSVNDAYDKQKETAAAAYQELKNNFNVAMISLGSSILPKVVDSTKSLTEALQTMGGFFEENQKATGLAISGFVKLAGVIGGAYMIGKITLFSRTVKAAMISSRASMVATATTAGVLRTAISAIPRNVAISIALVGISTLFSQLNKTRKLLNEIDANRLVKNKELEDSFTNQEKIRQAAVASENKALIDIEKRRSSLVQLKVEEEKAVRARSDAFFQKTKDNIDAEIIAIRAKYAIEEHAIGVLEGRLDDLGKAELATIRGDPTAPGAGIDEPSVGGGGGTGTSAADATVAAQAKILDSLIDTRTGFSELRTDGVNALSDLAREHDVRMGEMVDEAKELIASLGEIETAYNIRVAGFDQSAAEQVLAQEDVIAELEAKIAETAATGESTSELQSRLEREKAVLRDFLAENEDLTDEIAAARARASLTDFERFTSDLEIKREAAAADYQKEIEQIQTRLVNLQTSYDKEVAIYETKRDAIASMNDSISLYWSDTLTRMENRTAEAAAMMAAKLAAVRDSFAGIQGLSGESSSAADVQASSDFTSGQYSGGSNPSINLNFGDVNISNGQDAQNFIAELEATFTRILQLQNLGSTL